MNPNLQISGVPTNTVSLALILDDVDAPGGSFIHWLLWNISPSSEEIPENNVPNGSIQGINGFREVKYGGPCPPRGDNPHQYFFTLFSLSSEINLPEGSSITQIRQEMQDKIIKQTHIVGTFSRDDN